MSKGKWYKTRDNIRCALKLAKNSTTRAELVKAVMQEQGISYASANYAVNKASVRNMNLFKKLEAE